MHWFRVYNEIIDDPKVISLSWELRWRFIEVLSISSRQTERGTLPDTKTIAIHMRTSQERCENVLQQLAAAGLIDANPETKSLRVHSWDKRQFRSDSVSERTARWRERFRERAKNVPVNVPASVSVSVSGKEVQAGASEGGVGGEKGGGVGEKPLYGLRERSENVPRNRPENNGRYDPEAARKAKNDAMNAEIAARLKKGDVRKNARRDKST
jgi:hypothetical protein